MNLSLPFTIEKSTAIDALRLAIQSALAAIITYVIMTSIDMPELFLGILSAVLIVEPSVGDTFNQATGRVLSTVVGSAIGFVCVTLLPWGVGTAISLLIVMFVMNGVAGIKPDWRYGVVAALAITLGSESGAIDTSIDRVLAILFGVTVGVVVSLIVWPDKAENRALRYLKSALVAATERFEIAIEHTRTSDSEESVEIQGNYYKNINLAETAAAAVRFADASDIKEQIDLTKKLYNSILIVHRVAEQSERNITDGEANIEKDSEKLKNLACKLTKALAEDSKISDEELSKLASMADRLKDNLQHSEDDKSVNALRYTFLFGIHEIKDSIEALVKSFKKSS